jgi:hypothetical protein
MKIRCFWKWNLGVGLIVLPILSNCLAESTNPPAEPAAAVASATGSNTLLSAEAVKSDATNEIAQAVVQAVSIDKPLPANIRPSSPLAELIKLANAGVEEGVMLAFVTNSTSTFNLAAEDIIYLKDIGVPDPVVASMILRDQAIRGQAVTALASAPPPAAPAPTEPSQVPASEVAPQVDPNAPGYPAEPAPPVTEVVDDSGFYDSLAPYGSWVTLSGYGVCWQPSVVVHHPGWQPYYNCGRWVWTSCGWYWISDYSWGWAPFHYGRWFCHQQLGWCWTPDTVWGPSWVSWRYTSGYCGWAPLPPGACYAAGSGMTYHGRPVHYWNDCGVPASQYSFVSWNRFNDHHNNYQALSRDQHDRIYRESVVATRFHGDGNRIVNDGLPPAQVTTSTRAPVRQTELRITKGTTSPAGRSERFDADGRTLTVYRPELNPASRHPARWASAPSSQSAASAQSAQSAPSAPTYATRLPDTARSSPAMNNRTTRSDSEAMVGANRPSQNSSLILRGPQPSASRESVPKSSLVVIGRKDGTRSTTSVYSVTPSGASRAGSSARLAEVNSATPWVQESTGRQAPATPAQGAPSAISRVPARQLIYTPRNSAAGNGAERSAPAQTYRPAPSQIAPAQVPRSTPANNLSRPVAPAPASVPGAARSAPTVPSAPSSPGRGQR